MRSRTFYPYQTYLASSRFHPGFLGLPAAPPFLPPDEKDLLLAGRIATSCLRPDDRPAGSVGPVSFSSCNTPLAGALLVPATRNFWTNSFLLIRSRPLSLAFSSPSASCRSCLIKNLCCKLSCCLQGANLSNAS